MVVGGPFGSWCPGACPGRAGKGIKKAGGPIWPTALVRPEGGPAACGLARDGHRSPRCIGTVGRNASGEERLDHHSRRLLVDRPVPATCEPDGSLPATRNVCQLGRTTAVDGQHDECRGTACCGHRPAAPGSPHAGTADRWNASVPINERRSVLTSDGSRRTHSACEGLIRRDFSSFLRQMAFRESTPPGRIAARPNRHQTQDPAVERTREVRRDAGRPSGIKGRTSSSAATVASPTRAS